MQNQNTTGEQAMPVEIPVSFHEAVLATMASNQWDYAYALGYVSGQDDRTAQRKAAVPQSCNDDYAKGYWLAYGNPTHTHTLMELPDFAGLRSMPRHIGPGKPRYR